MGKMIRITRFITVSTLVDSESYRNFDADGEAHPRQMTIDEIREFEMNIGLDQFLDRTFDEASEAEPENIDVATQVKWAHDESL